jgi:hypothetical protein
VCPRASSASRAGRRKRRQALGFDAMIDYESEELLRAAA